MAARGPAGAGLAQPIAGCFDISSSFEKIYLHGFIQEARVSDGLLCGIDVIVVPATWADRTSTNFSKWAVTAPSRHH